MPNFILLCTYCASWYGCQAWQLGAPYSSITNVEWQKAVHRTAGLHKQTIIVLLPGLAGNGNFRSQHEHCLTGYLWSTMSASNNPVILFLATRLSDSATEEYTQQTGISAEDWAKDCWPILCMGPSLKTFLVQVSELVHTRDELALIDNLEPEDIALVHVFKTTYLS